VSAHLKEQLLRFARVSWWAFVVSVVATGGHVSWASLASLAVGALETGYRQLMQVEPKPTVTAVLADPPKPPGGTP
jgi:hypothetical protein